MDKSNNFNTTQICVKSTEIPKKEVFKKYHNPTSYLSRMVLPNNIKSIILFQQYDIDITIFS